jgi:hypothetical protein
MEHQDKITEKNIKNKFSVRFQYHQTSECWDSLGHINETPKNMYMTLHAISKIR